MLGSGGVSPVLGLGRLSRPSSLIGSLTPAANADAVAGSNTWGWTLLLNRRVANRIGTCGIWSSSPCWWEMNWLGTKGGSARAGVWAPTSCLRAERSTQLRVRPERTSVRSTLLSWDASLPTRSIRLTRSSARQKFEARIDAASWLWIRRSARRARLSTSLGSLLIRVRRLGRLPETVRLSVGADTAAEPVAGTSAVIAMVVAKTTEIASRALRMTSAPLKWSEGTYTAAGRRRKGCATRPAGRTTRRAGRTSRAGGDRRRRRGSGPARRRRRGSARPWLLRARARRSVGRRWWRPAARPASDCAR